MEVCFSQIRTLNRLPSNIKEQQTFIGVRKEGAIKSETRRMCRVCGVGKPY